MAEELPSRVAVLEAQMERVQSKEDAILVKLEHIEKEMTRYKGFLGGVAFLGSCLWAALVILREYFTGKV